jgi:hypothetical protein
MRLQLSLRLFKGARSAPGQRLAAPLGKRRAQATLTQAWRSFRPSPSRPREGTLRTRDGLRPPLHVILPGSGYRLSEVWPELRFSTPSELLPQVRNIVGRGRIVGPA